MRYLETVVVGIEELDPFPGNARVHATDVLEDSAKVNGQYRSIVARRTSDGALEILAGHGTRDAFAAIGATDVRVEVIEADDAEAARIVLVDNRGNDLAGYDNAGLLELLSNLDGDFQGTGYTAQVIADLQALLDDTMWDDGDTPGGGGLDLDEALAPRIDLRVDVATFEGWMRLLGTQTGATDADKLRAYLVANGFREP